MAKRFEEFWMTYPRRKEKKAARTAYEKALKDGVDETTLIEAAKIYRDQCIGKEPKFIKYPATWLNRGCWDDEPDTVIKPSEELRWKNIARKIKSPATRHNVDRQTAEEALRRGLVTADDIRHLTH